MKRNTEDSSVDTGHHKAAAKCFPLNKKNLHVGGVSTSDLWLCYHHMLGPQGAPGASASSTACRAGMTYFMTAVAKKMCHSACKDVLQMTQPDSIQQVQLDSPNKSSRGHREAPSRDRWSTSVQNHT